MTSTQLSIHAARVQRDRLGSLGVVQALRDGGVETKASAFVMGLGNIVHRQAVKGVLFLAAEIAYIIFMVRSGFHNLAMLVSLGSVQQEEIWNEELQVYLYTKGDQSILLLLYGVATILVTIVMFWIWRGTVKSAFKAELCDKNGWPVNTFSQDLHGLLDENLYRLLMTPSMFFIGVLTILPLIFMICMAFTNYSKIGDHLVLFDWVGLENFATLFDGGSVLGGTFWSVLAWTLVWAFFATFTNYFAGMVLAIVINRKDTKIKGFWRFCFVISCAVPMFVSLLIMRTMLQPEGAVNVLLRNMGLIASDASLPFFTNATWARVTVIIINIWVGVPYTLLQLTGVLQNIPGDLYEAADLDGANKVQQFFKITLPYMLYVTTPYLIATFTGNVNNFNVIYLLSEGQPVVDLSSTAGATDLLVTWLYKLTIDKQYYNIGAVVGILTFIILAIGSLLTYRNSKSYKEEGGF
ncbi:MAG: sugar ABC transporter permease [Oscillospiraceae bacterium]|nr:sugar ABC transporter permease [Oscillospiraceae bacterium]